MSPIEEKRKTAAERNPSSERYTQTSVTCLIAVIIGVLLYRSTERLPPQAPRLTDVEVAAAAPFPGASARAVPQSSNASAPTASALYEYILHARNETLKADISRQLGLYVAWDHLFDQIASLEPDKRKAVLLQIANGFGLPPSLTFAQIKAAVCAGNRLPPLVPLIPVLAQTTPPPPIAILPPPVTPISKKN